MPTHLWGDVQRARCGRFPDAIGESDIARCFHLDERDQAIITELRGAHNRLGLAAQLGAVRFIGAFPSEITTVPPVVLDTLARQRAETPAASLDDYWSGRQRWRHVALIKERYGFRDFADASLERFRLMRWLYALCWAGDERPGLLMERAVAWLLAEQVLLPGVGTLERFCAHVRARVHDQRWRRMAGAFDTEQSAYIARLFDSGDGTALIEELRRAPRRLADIGGARFWRIDRNADYGAFDRLARNQIDTKLVAAAWPDLLRLAGSLKLGRVKADAVMRILQVKERPTPLARALAPCSSAHQLPRPLRLHAPRGRRPRRTPASAQPQFRIGHLQRLMSVHRSSRTHGPQRTAPGATTIGTAARWRCRRAPRLRLR